MEELKQKATEFNELVKKLEWQVAFDQKNAKMLINASKVDWFQIKKEANQFILHLEQTKTDIKNLVFEEKKIVVVWHPDDHLTQKYDCNASCFHESEYGLPTTLKTVRDFANAFYTYASSFPDPKPTTIHATFHACKHLASPILGGVDDCWIYYGL